MRDATRDHNVFMCLLFLAVSGVKPLHCVKAFYSSTYVSISAVVCFWWQWKHCQIESYLCGSCRFESDSPSEETADTILISPSCCLTGTQTLLNQRTDSYTYLSKCVRTDAGGVLHHGVDLDHGGVVFDEQIVQFDHVLRRLLHQGWWEAHLLSYLQQHKTLDQLFILVESVNSDGQFNPCIYTGTLETTQNPLFL